MQNINESTVVLAIGAHPDDIEVGCGATVAKLAGQGAQIHYCVATDGNRGSRQHVVDKAQLINTRAQEEQAAAKILGAKSVSMLAEEDGNLQCDIVFKEKIVRLIRALKPDIVITHDPNFFYYIDKQGKAHVNHTDHRACGIAVLDAVYPLARDLQSFPEHIADGLSPHIVPELYLFNFHQPTFAVDVSQFEGLQMEAIKAHASQFDNPDQTEAWLHSMHQNIGDQFGLPAAEGFIRLQFN